MGVKSTKKGTGELSRSDGNVLCLDLGDHYMDVYVIKTHDIGFAYVHFTVCKFCLILKKTALKNSTYYQNLIMFPH